jgi:hypothetical protein
MMFLYVQTLIFLAFVMSAFFANSKTAGQFGGLFMLLIFLPGYAIKDSTPAGAIGIATLLSPIAFSRAFAALADAESAHEGLSFNGNMTGGPSTPFPFGTALIMFLVDSFLYAILAWYLEQVLPTEYGTTRRPCFCLTPTSCTKNKSSSSAALSSSNDHQGAQINNQSLPAPSSVIHVNNSNDNTAVASSSPPSSGAAGTDWGVTEPVNQRVSDRGQLRINGLRKVFDPKPCTSGEASKGSLVAVDNLNLTMYEGQILSLVLFRTNHIIWAIVILMR